MEDKRVVVERRGQDVLEWSGEDGLIAIHMTPFGLVGEFADRELTTEVISWYEISGVKIFDLKFEDPDAGTSIESCPDCSGSGLRNEGNIRCERCDGWGHLGKTE